MLTFSSKENYPNNKPSPSLFLPPPDPLENIHKVENKTKQNKIKNNTQTPNNQNPALLGLWKQHVEQNSESGSAN